ncbi:MAG TPA: phosphoribosylglycinamide formyltransferase [Chloroflexia bacterium]|nr:phosphoribosylglycinamide formyltransferase [Chloroflexia bacterium]
MDALRVPKPLKLGVLVSGRGTNLQAIIDAIRGGELDATVELVVCNHAGAQAISRARTAGLPVEVHELGDYPSRLAKQRAIASSLERTGVDLVVCAGWDRVLKPEFIRRFAGRIINVHPSLLPAFGGGLHAIEEAWNYGVKLTGCTVHFVTEEVDSGPIISQAAVHILEDDTLDTLTERIHKEEHSLLVEAIALYGRDALRVLGRKVERKAAAQGSLQATIAR